MPALVMKFGGNKPKPKSKPPTMPPPPFPKDAEEKDEAPPSDAPAPAPAKPKAPGPPKLDVAVVTGGAGPTPKKPFPPAKASGMPVGDEPEAMPDGDETLQPMDVGYGLGSCHSCAHMDGEQCVKYGFPVEGEGHCLSGYEARHDEMSQGPETSEASQDEGIGGQ